MKEVKNNFAGVRVCIGLAALAACAAVCQAQPNSTYTISTYAGNGTRGFADASSATGGELAGPARAALDSGGSLYIADQGNQRIRQVQPSGSISTIAGNGTAGYSGDGHAAISAELYNPFGVIVDGSGNYYIADTYNDVVRKVTSGATISTIAGINDEGPGYSGDGGAATSAQLFQPSGLALDSSGNLYIADTANDVIRMVTSGGTITTIAGNNQQTYAGDGGPAVKAGLNSPSAVAVDSAGNIYIADSGNHRIRKISNGIITTVAGTGTAGFSGDGGPAIAAKLNRPLDVAVDSSGNLYIADNLNSRIRVVLASGAIETIAGNGSFGYTGDGGAAKSGALNFPTGVAVSPSGKIYVADSQNNVIRLLTPMVNSAAPSINSGGVIQAGSFGASSSVAPGSWIEIYGTSLASTTRTWASTDFKNGVGPSTLAGTTVTIGGQAAFLSYVSGNQIDAQIPSNIGTGAQSITVATSAGISSSYPITVNATQPGLFAPSQFNIGGQQYVGALFSDGTTYVLPPGAVAGIASKEAKAGDTITIYAVGLGPVSPNIPAGQIVTQSNQITTPIQILFGPVQATSITYQGLAPQEVGLYQINVVVPQGAPTGDAVPLTIMQNGVNGSQTLYIAISM